LSNTTWHADPVLAPLLAAARADPEVEGVLLGGSRGAGVHDHESDYDLAIVLTDAAFERRRVRGDLLHIRQHPIDPRLDVTYTHLQALESIIRRASWELPGYATAQILYDKTGRLAEIVQAMITMPAERAHADVLAWFDAYLNAFYRSLKAWRRGNVLGAQLQAAESAMHVVRVLFALEQRWPPYHDRLLRQLDTLATQGWPAGYLAEALLRLVQTGDPTLQQALELRVETLLRDRGFTLDLWDGEIDRVKAWHFQSANANDVT
jgi:hypothetical protein